MRLIQADLLGAFDLDDTGIVDDNLHDAEAQGIDLFPDQLQPGVIVALGIRRAIFISRIHAYVPFNE